MKTPTRQRLVESAVRRFYRDGFRSVGIDQILADVEISKTAFYKHFESKEDLMLAALEEQKNWAQNVFQTMIRDRGGNCPVSQLHAVFDVVEHIMESDDFHGCIFVNASMEFPLPHEPAHILAAKGKQAIEDVVFNLAVAAAAPNPRALAQELCLIIEGAYVTRVVTAKPSTIEIARGVARLVINSHCPEVAASLRDADQAVQPA
jgi:AcrR family transcriptional regulator